MKTVYLVRHCEYDNPRKIFPGRLSVELSEEGAARAKRLQKYFEDKNIQKIYSSAVKRCQQTAEIISNTKIPIINDVRILETLDPSQGINMESPNDWSMAYAYTTTLGGESMADVGHRMAEFWEKVVANETDDIIICSHGDPLYFLHCYLTHQPFQREAIDTERGPDYPPKGSIRPIVINQDGSYTIEAIIQV